MCFFHKIFLFVSAHNNFWASVYNLNFVIIHDNVSISVFIIAFSRKSLENKIRRRKDHVLNYPNAKKITHETAYILRNYFFFHGIICVRQFFKLVQLTQKPWFVHRRPTRDPHWKLLQDWLRSNDQRKRLILSDHSSNIMKLKVMI
jgi:hypothetical protein